MPWASYLTTSSYVHLMRGGRNRRVLVPRQLSLLGILWIGGSYSSRQSSGKHGSSKQHSANTRKGKSQNKEEEVTSPTKPESDKNSKECMPPKKLFQENAISVNKAPRKRKSTGKGVSLVRSDRRVQPM